MKFTFLLFLILSAVSFSACQTATKNEPVKSEAEIKQVSVSDAKTAIEKPDVQFIDVRTPEEYNGGHAVKAVNLPLDNLENDLAKLDKEKPVYVICQSGRRSQKGSEILQKAGFKDVSNVTGGTSAWQKAELPIEK